MPALVTFLSDYGLRDEFVGVVHAVIAAECPPARVIDLSHGVPAQDVRAGALMLARALPHVPAAVHLAVVDPGVGSARRAVALRCGDGRLLVGPDNGLLAPAAEGAGGVVAAREISSSPWRREPVSATFHGRDIFAPVAARLAAGEPLEAAGSELDPAELAGLELPVLRRTRDGIVADVLDLDGFGNLLLAPGGLAAAGLREGDAVEVAGPAGQGPARVGRTFADVAPGELVLYADAAGMLALAVNGGSAAARLGAGRDAELRLRPAGRA